MAFELDPALTGLKNSGSTAPPPHLPDKVPEAGLGVAVVGAVSLVVVAGGLWWWSRRGTGATPPLSVAPEAWGL